jgi:[ribosomal protein S18]-alanine N-acetyltransferase
MTKRPVPQPRAIRLRPGHAADVAVITALEMACFARAPERFHRRQVHYLVTRAQSVILVAESGGQLLGWAAGLLRRHAGGGRRAFTGRVYALVVSPEARGQRLGQRLLERLLAELARRGAQRVTLEVRKDNHPAIALYRKFGFGNDKHLVHYYGRGFHGLHMARNL